MKKRKTGLQINDRDRKLFEYLYENKVATRQQIARDLSWNAAHQTIYRRLNKLIRNHLLESRSQQETGFWRLVYSLGKSGFDRFIDQGAGLRKEYRSQSIPHDLALVDIRFALTRSNRVRNYYTENLLKGSGRSLLAEEYHSFLDIHPDAIVDLDFPTGDLLVTLEYESSQKYADRYEKLFHSYCGREEIPAVLYVCKNQTLRRNIQAIEKQIQTSGRRKFFYSTISDLDRKDELIFENLDQEKIIIDGLPAPASIHASTVGDRTAPQDLLSNPITPRKQVINGESTDENKSLDYYTTNSSSANLCSNLPSTSQSAFQHLYKHLSNLSIRSLDALTSDDLQRLQKLLKEITARNDLKSSSDSTEAPSKSKIYLSKTVKSKRNEGSNSMPRKTKNIEQNNTIKQEQV